MTKTLSALLLAALCWLPALAQAGDGAEIMTRLQERMAGLSGFETEFSQRLTNAASGEDGERKGKLYFKQPRLIRWETHTPERELLVAGKDVVWDYFADEEIAYKYDPKQLLSSQTMLRFISGQGGLAEEFILTEYREEHGLAALELIPREPEPALVEVRLWVDVETLLLKKIRMVDFYGNGNELEFIAMTLDPELPDKLFRFTPPAGVFVVEDNGGEVSPGFLLEEPLQQ